MITAHYYFETMVIPKNRKKPKKERECCFVRTVFEEKWTEEDDNRFSFVSEYKHAVSDLIYREEFADDPIELELGELPLWFLKNEV